MPTETRFRYENITDPPEGWVHLHNQFDDRGYFALWADSKEYRPDRRTVWIEMRKITQQREVSEWVDA